MNDTSSIIKCIQLKPELLFLKSYRSLAGTRIYHDTNEVRWFVNRNSIAIHISMWVNKAWLAYKHITAGNIHVMTFIIQKEQLNLWIVGNDTTYFTPTISFAHLFIIKDFD